MELKVWSKTLLNIYSCLFKLATAIDKVVLDFGLNSGRYFGFSQAFNDAEKIIKLTDRKIILINIKVLIEKILNGLDETSCKILTLKYIDKMSNDTIMEALNIKRRTYFRKYNAALNSFTNALIVNGFNKDSIYKLIDEETWIYDVYNEILKKEISKHNEGDISKLNILYLAVKNFKLAKRNDCIF